jgi:hypothetical protein
MLFYFLERPALENQQQFTLSRVQRWRKKKSMGVNIYFLRPLPTACKHYGYNVDSICEAYHRCDQDPPLRSKKMIGIRGGEVFRMDRGTGAIRNSVQILQDSCARIEVLPDCNGYSNCRWRRFTNHIVNKSNIALSR